MGSGTLKQFAAQDGYWGPPVSAYLLDSIIPSSSLTRAGRMSIRADRKLMLTLHLQLIARVLERLFRTSLEQQEHVVVRLHEETVVVDAIPRCLLHQREVALLLLHQAVRLLA